MENFIRQKLTSSSGIFPGSEIKKINSVSGGCIHKSWKIELVDDRKFFAKTASNKLFRILKFEADSLHELNKFAYEAYINIPKPITLRCFKNFAILILPWLNLENGDQTNLGKGLAILHKDS